MRQITDEKFKELYEEFQKQKNNLGSDTEFAEFLNKKKLNQEHQVNNLQVLKTKPLHLKQLMAEDKDLVLKHLP